MRVLHLTLHRRWFLEILSGSKTEEYRSMTDYWRTRLEGREYDEIHFRNGYNKDAPFMRVEFRELRRAIWDGKQVYCIRLGEVLERRHT